MRRTNPTYPPLDEPKPVAPDLWVVDSVLPGPAGRVFATRMTVIRLPSGELLLYSPTRYSAGLGRALAELGPVRHLVAPSLAHWMFVEGWQAACPEAVSWAAPGLARRRAVRRAGVRFAHTLGDAPPPAWGEGIALFTVPGGLGFRETLLLHRPSRSLLLCDLVMNLDASRLPPLARGPVGLSGMDRGLPPPYLRAVVRAGGDRARHAVEAALATSPERAIFAHGLWFDGHAAVRLRHALRWLLEPRRTGRRRP